MPRRHQANPTHQIAAGAFAPAPRESLRCGCGGVLYDEVIPFSGGEARLVCYRCGAASTSREWRAAQVAAAAAEAPTPAYGRKGRRCESRRCQQVVPPRQTGQKGPTPRYCSNACRDRERKARIRDLSRAATATVVHACACGCGRTFVRGPRQQRRRYWDDRCRVRHWMREQYHAKRGAVA